MWFSLVWCENHKIATGLSFFQVPRFSVVLPLKAEYFNNQDFAGEPDWVRFEERIRFDWTDGPPHPEISNLFSVRFTQTIKNRIPWWYTFSILANGGFRSNLDGNEFYSQWNSTFAETFEPTQWLWSGSHEWAILYKNTADTMISATYVEWPVKIAWADTIPGGSFDRIPASAPLIGGEPIEGIAPYPAGSIVLDDQSSIFKVVGAEGLWVESDGGYANHFYWIVGNRSTSAAVQWVIEVPAPGDYDLFAYIPQIHASTESARYQIHHAVRQSEVILDQVFHQNTWANLGTFAFDGESLEFISLGSQTNDEDRTEVAADAIAFIRHSPSPVDDWLDQFRVWFQDQLENIQQYIEGIIESGQKKLQEEIELLIRNIQERFLSWLKNEFEKLLGELCIPAMMLPIWALLGFVYLGRRRMIN